MRPRAPAARGASAASVAARTGDEPQYKEVRGLARGLALLRALNTMPGGTSSTSDLARHCNIHRTTAKRLLETLRAEGLVAAGDGGGQYRLAPDVKLLSDGFVEDEWIARVAVPLLRDAASTLVWPCNVATIDGGAAVIRASTRKHSPLAHDHAPVGTRLPVLRSSLGRAFLAALHPDIARSVRDVLVERERGRVAGEVRALLFRWTSVESRRPRARRDQPRVLQRPSPHRTDRRTPARPATAPGRGNRLAQPFVDRLRRARPAAHVRANEHLQTHVSSKFGKQ